MISRKGRVAVAAAAAALGLSALIAPSANAAGKTIVIWADKLPAPAITQVAKGFKGATVKVVVRDFGKMRDDLKAITPADAPDLVFGAHDWTGEFAANGTVVKLSLPAALGKQYGANALDAFSYNGSLYGMPMVVENMALVRNADLAPTAPKTMDEMIATIKSLWAAGKTDKKIGIAIPGGDPYHHYGFFSGLGGYIFGTTPNGGADPTLIGLDNPKLMSNASKVDSWVKDGILSASVDYGAAKTAFMDGKAAFWYTGAWEAGNIAKITNFKVSVDTYPTIVPGVKSVPFLGYQGIWVTKYAKTHGVDAEAKQFLLNFLAPTKGATAISNARGLAPANLTAKNNDKWLAAFGKNARYGVAMPNIPEMGKVWGDLGSAWGKTTKASEPVPARTAFQQAANTIRNLING